MTHLLDTNAFVDHLRRGPASTVTAKLLAAPPGSVALCSVVLAELLYGAVRSGPAHEAANRALLAGLRAQFPCLPFDVPAAEAYGTLRAYLAGLGQLIGPNDLMIAAIALANGLTLVTHNTSEFSRVPGLPLEDWQ
ncbi:MAG: type II toxin-antitoxin system VapC family toxin [Gemmataceae bacterium]|nr:type II toxin-antitoxin system VapC family toxin [Gemmataceae bacterium]